MGNLYSKISGRGASAAAATAVSSDGSGDQAIDPVTGKPAAISADSINSAGDPISTSGIIHPDNDISVGIEVKANGESDDSHLVTSSSSATANPADGSTGHHRNGVDHNHDEEDEDTDDTECDVNNASLDVHPSTEDTLANVSETNGHHASSSSSSSPAGKSAGESVATWAQVVAGMHASGTPAPAHVPMDSNDTDEQESITSDDSSINSADVANGRANRSGNISANGNRSSTRNQRSPAGKRSSSSRTATPTNSPSKRLRGSGANPGESSPSSGSGGRSVSGVDSDRPFACRAPGCEWAFKALFHLNRHRKTVHGFNEPVTAASYQLMQQQWAAQQQSPAAAVAPSPDQVLEVDGQVHHHHHQQQDMSNFFDHVLLDANSPNTY